MKVLVYGGRDWDDQKTMDRVLDTLHEQYRFSLVINGEQISRKGDRLFGADWQARKWGHAQGIHLKLYRPNWNAQGRAAGPIRNQRMIDEGKPELAVEFPGGRGTADMGRRLEAAGIQIIDAMTVEKSTTPS